MSKTQMGLLRLFSFVYLKITILNVKHNDTSVRFKCNQLIRPLSNSPTSKLDEFICQFVQSLSVHLVRFPPTTRNINTCLYVCIPGEHSWTYILLQRLLLHCKPLPSLTRSINRYPFSIIHIHSGCTFLEIHTLSGGTFLEIYTLSKEIS